MDGTRNERARARAQHLLAQIAPLLDDAEVQRLRELSMDCIREAERIEEGVTTVESSEQITTRLDAVARDFFARALHEMNQQNGRRPPRSKVAVNGHRKGRARAWLVDGTS
ncbi:hypothetical protein [Bradyrhizobium sp. 6(2017)]|uniref:hypothetical protein n=1 Tax=Bradyrhizobium sp. 6(2017) TaxID=1197460 RepID=UPI0013E1A0CA|nr:hypothetical protein [Bradyrhizobium sp. 6(2017)]QIG96551.1 hypothetical protein G6P99_31865 [Bradyrhizobium sp. 6(2017)]